MQWVTILSLTFLLVGKSNQKETFEGYQVFQTKPIDSNDSIRKLIQFVESDSYNAFDFWAMPRFEGSIGKIMTAPGHQERLRDFLMGLNIDFEVIIKDVEKVNQIAEKEQTLRRMSRKNNSAIDWENYYDLENIYDYLDEMSKQYTNVSVEVYGQTYEGRELKALKIARAGKDAPNVIVEAGIHAREWIAPSMATYIIHSLLEEEDGHKNYLDKFNFHIIPVANPDGYVFSRSSNRLWRKNRAKTYSFLCKGVDANRNFDFHWHEIGVSDNPCSDIYPGKKAFSEAESKYLTDYLLKLNPSPVFVMGLHSAADLFLLPYSYSHDARPDHFDELLETVQGACDNLNKVNGMEFQVIHTPNLYPCGGVSHDWYMGVLGSKYAFTIELRQGGIFGFDLPVEQIKPSGEELWAAFTTMLNKI
ncbi:carboxypeptidase B [Lepeophtheirus salmonis]|nr:carboxypeptidase B-like [Lepeophtheirus salmonis]